MSHAILLPPYKAKGDGQLTSPPCSSRLVQTEVGTFSSPLQQRIVKHVNLASEHPKVLEEGLVGFPQAGRDYVGNIWVVSQLSPPQC